MTHRYAYFTRTIDGIDLDIDVHSFDYHAPDPQADNTDDFHGGYDITYTAMRADGLPLVMDANLDFMIRAAIMTEFGGE